MDRLLDYVMSMSKEEKKVILDALLAEKNKENCAYEEAFEKARKEVLDDIRKGIKYSKFAISQSNPGSASYREDQDSLKYYEKLHYYTEEMSFSSYCEFRKHPDFGCSSSDIDLKVAESIQRKITWNEDDK